MGTNGKASREQIAENERKIAELELKLAEMKKALRVRNEGGVAVSRQVELAASPQGDLDPVRRGDEVASNGAGSPKPWNGVPDDISGRWFSDGTTSPVSASLPADLVEALRAEKARYRTVTIRSVDQSRLEEGLVVLQPLPAADLDWIGGAFLAFCEENFAWGGEIVHVDAVSGDTFVLPSGGVPSEETLGSAKRWFYKPFDFADAILGAANATPHGHPTLTNALRWVIDGARELARPVPAASLEEPWDAQWGLIWGPPGTGKTQSVAERVADFVTAHPEQRVVAIAPTNRAVDELTLRICRCLKARDALKSKAGAFPVFRGGVGAGRALAAEFPESLHDLAYRQLAQRREELHQAIARLQARGADAGEVAQKKAELREIEKLRDETLVAVKRGNSMVVTLTVHRALRLVAELQGEPVFHKAILDEGGMISRASAALVSPLAKTLLAAGDPKQIGPVSRASEGAPSVVQKWLRSSPLSHLRDARGDTSASNVFLIRTQHRMHPAIARVVSEFQYAGQLLDGPTPKRLESSLPVGGLPAARAVWVVLDDSTKDHRLVCHDRPETGRGYVRRLSAELLTALADGVVSEGNTVLAATPYRAQAQLLRSMALEAELDVDTFTASTIHRQQGAEYDVVFIDTVAAGRPFQPNDLCAMLNVAASRARKHLFVLASRAEAEAVIPSRFLSLFETMRVVPGATPRLEPTSVRVRRSPDMPRDPDKLGTEIHNLMALGPIYTDEQVKLFERHFGEGHYLVRGVAGSGKTFVLANWVARMLRDEPRAHVLVSFFNKALTPLVEKLVRKALEERLDASDVENAYSRIRVAHVDLLQATIGPNGKFDAVFVDEAQDMGPERLEYLYRLAQTVQDRDGQTRRRFCIFMDDSQNVYGRKPIEEFREKIDKSINFSGRTRVMKEAFRSTREILDLAFNVVLDPKQVHGVTNPGMKEFLKENELVQEGLLRRPGEGRDGLYHVDYTERGGAIPTVISAPDVDAEARELVRVVKDLHMNEGVRLSDILVVSPFQPDRWANALQAAGVKATAFGGKRGEDAASFPIGRVDFVRATTIFSCKGHESPIVLLCGTEGLDSLEEWMKELKGADPRVAERQKRCLFYVGATRAMVRQYILGLSSSRFARTAQAYAEALCSVA